jgi:glycosyltransferase involved in cell wall biosynthesis
MRVLYITANDVTGQQFNGYLLHRELLATGHQSHMAVAHSGFNQPEIHEVGGPVLRLLNQCIVKAELKLSLYSVLPVSAVTLYFAAYYRSADIIHLQLPHADQFFSLFHVPVMSRKHKLIWTLHDPWMTSGHCIHPMDCNRWMSGCGKCPDLTLPISLRSDRTRLLWRIKHWVMHRSDVHLVVASHWMLDKVRRSPILSHLPCSLIPLGIDTEMFRPLDKAACRAKFGIPENANVLAFRWTPYFVVKGAEYIKSALESLHLDRPTYLLTFDAPVSYGLDSLGDKYHYVDLGWVADRHVIVDALNAADLFLMPSIAESFGMMAVEAMACGTPVVVFEGTSLPAVIHAPEGGTTVPFKDAGALAIAVEGLLKDRERRESLSVAGLAIVRREYTMGAYIQRHFELYENLIGG